MISLGIIGTGIIAHEHAKATLTLGDIRLTAVSNRTISKAMDFAKLYGVDPQAVYQDYRDMLSREKLDAVIVCLANHLHAEAFQACAEHGVAVLMEKPLAQNSAECEVINACAQKNAIKLMLGHTQRYNNYYQTAKQIIDSGSLGKLIAMKDCIHYNYFWEGRPAWFLDPALCGGGILMNYGVHTFDRIQFLSGTRIEKVFAHVDWDMDDFSVDSGYQVQSLHTDGVTSSMTCTGYSGPFSSSTEMVFRHGILRVFLFGNALDQEGVWLGTNEQDFKQVPSEKTNAYVRQLSDFCAYVRNEIPCPIDGAYGEAMVRQVEASYRSHYSGMAELV
jgi:predicted dehydrogenase